MRYSCIASQRSAVSVDNFRAAPMGQGHSLSLHRKKSETAHTKIIVGIRRGSEGVGVELDGTGGRGRRKRGVIRDQARTELRDREAQTP